MIIPAQAVNRPPANPSTTEERPRVAKSVEAKSAPPKEFNDILDKVKDALGSPQADIEYKVDKDTGIMFFKVVNPVTKEVIRQVPTEEMVALVRQIKKQANRVSGVILNNEA